MPWLLPTAAQMVDRAPCILGHTAPTNPCAASHDEMFIWLSCCAAPCRKSISFEICGEMLLMASLKAKPSALLATPFIIATSSPELMNEKEPANRSIPPHPARALGNCRLKGWTLRWGKRVQTLPPE